MTGEQFEVHLCDVLSRMGYWAHRMSRDRTGAQPFDVIAICGEYVLAVDCKVISGNYGNLPLDRIEPNQWSSFERIQSRTNADVGVVILHRGSIFFYRYRELKEIAKTRKSITLDTWHEWISRDKVMDVLGRDLT